MQRSRRADPYPLTWELPVAILCAVLLVIAVGAHLGRAVANVSAGAGWTWPAQAELFRSAPGVLAGDAAAGLTGHGPFAGPAAVWTWTALTELLLLAVTIWATRWALARWGPHRVQGMATRSQAEQLLGLTRLRKVAPIIRPDLHGGKRGRP